MRVDRRYFLKLLGVSAAGAALPPVREVAAKAKEKAPYIKAVREVRPRRNAEMVYEVAVDLDEYDRALGRQVREAMHGAVVIDPQLVQAELTIEGAFPTPPMIGSLPPDEFLVPTPKILWLTATFNGRGVEWHR